MKVKENMIISYRTSRGFDPITREEIESYICRQMILKIYKDATGVEKAKVRDMETGIEFTIQKLYYDVLLSNKEKIVRIEEG